MIGWYSWKGWLMMLPLDRFTVFICNLWEDSCGIVEIATHPNGSIHRSLFILLMAEIPRPTTWDRLGSAKPCKCWDKPPVEVGSLSHYFDKVLHIPGVCLGFLPSTVSNYIPTLHPHQKQPGIRPYEETQLLYVSLRSTLLHGGVGFLPSTLYHSLI